MADDLFYVYCTATVLVGTILIGVFRKSFDPFAPVWLFLMGFGQVYVIQAITNHEDGVFVRGPELVEQANARALWALIWFLFVYYCGFGKFLAARLPKPPTAWSPGVVCFISPWLIIWGLVCAGVVAGSSDGQVTEEASLFRSFPILMLLGAILLVVTGRQPDRPNPVLTGAGLFVAFLYCAIWIMNGKRSPPLFGVLASVCAFYVSRGRRPSKPVLLATAIAGILIVAVAIGWRNTRNYPRSLSGFAQFVGDFDVAEVLVSLNVKDPFEGAAPTRALASKETEEYGGFLLMMDTVPHKSDYDYGASYLRLISTYIPRLIWRDKPLYGREQWVNAWIAGSEFKRDETFTGPAIGILGATQLNGGAVGTAIVLAVLALLLRTTYEFFRRYGQYAWVQAWWSLTFYNSWLMTVNDDPFVWFYYIYGHTMVPPLVMLWIYNKWFASGDVRAGLGAGHPAGMPIAAEA